MANIIGSSNTVANIQIRKNKTANVIRSSITVAIYIYIYICISERIKRFMQLNYPTQLLIDIVYIYIYIYIYIKERIK